MTFGFSSRTYRAVTVAGFLPGFASLGAVLTMVDLDVMPARVPAR
ncbi:hypothetical protein [Amycolatopsis sp. cmx-4-68]